MEQRDFLKDQIEQVGKILAEILSGFLGMKSKGLVSEGIEITDQRLQSELNIEIEKLISLSKKELKEYLNNRQLTADQLEILSECMKEISQGEIERNKKEMKMEKAIELLDIADEISKTMSFNRINKKNEIKKILQHR